MSKVHKPIKRLFKSPTIITVHRAYFALPLLVLLALAAIWGDKHLLTHSAPLQPPSGNVKGASTENLSTTKNTSLQVAPDSDSELEQAASYGDKSASPSPQSNVSSHGINNNSSGSSTALQQSGQAAAGLINGTVDMVDDVCTAAVNGILDTYYGTVSAADNLLTSQLAGLPIIGSLTASMDDKNQYNETVQTAYKSAQAQATKKGCTLPISAPTPKS
jgi:hypothetical protein